MAADGHAPLRHRDARAQAARESQRVQAVGARSYLAAPRAACLRSLDCRAAAPEDARHRAAEPGPVDVRHTAAEPDPVDARQVDARHTAAAADARNQDPVPDEAADD